MTAHRPNHSVQTTLTNQVNPRAGPFIEVPRSFKHPQRLDPLLALSQPLDHYARGPEVTENSTSSRSASLPRIISLANLLPYVPHPCACSAKNLAGRRGATAA